MTWNVHPSRLSAICIVVIIVGTAAPSVWAAGGGGSTTVATELTSLLVDRHLDAIAVQDPEAPNRFVAALLIPNAQLLVVSADYPTPAELQSQIARKNYRDVYAALHQPASLQTRVFFIDAGCDGLRSSGDNVDVMYEKGKQTMFDGRWKQQGLSSETAYQKKVTDADEQYAKLLSLLVAAVKAPPTESGR